MDRKEADNQISLLDFALVIPQNIRLLVLVPALLLWVFVRNAIANSVAHPDQAGKLVAIRGGCHDCSY